MSTSPGLATAIEELRAVFPTDAALQDAIARLTSIGFDRADLSLPDMAAPPDRDTPEAGAADPNTDTDSRQLRTMGTGIAASAGAMAAAGVAVATGGLAAPAIAAAVIGGLGAGAASQVAHREADRSQSEDRRTAAERGELVLSVRLRDASSQAKAEAALEAAGATKIASVVRSAPGSADSAAWTG